MKMKTSNHNVISNYIVSLFILFCSFGRVLGARFQRDLAVTAFDTSHIGLGCEEMIEIHNYKCEEHSVTTQDGYILGVQRIPSGRFEEPVATPKPAVLLQHGLFADANCWLVIGERSLGFYLADKGFDVWLTNTRGTRYSRHHTSLLTTQPEFWDWSWDQLSEYDLTAVVGYVSQQTQQRVHYVGHSLGTTIALGALSSNAAVVNQMRSASLLSPIAHLNHITSPFAKAAAHLFMAEIGSRIGSGEYSPTSQLASELFAQICQIPGVDCSVFMTTMAGISCCLNESSVSVLLDHGIQSSSTKLLTQLSQDIRTGIIAKYDYGNPTENTAHYGAPVPPLYVMANIPKDFPLFVSYGATDSLGDIADVEILLAELMNHDSGQLVKNFNLGYAHMDFLMANDVVERIYEPLVSFLSST